jgi:nucleolar protein 56
MHRPDGNGKRSERVMSQYLIFNAFGVFIIKNKEIIDKKFFTDPHSPLEEIQALHEKYPEAVLENKEMAEKLHAAHEFPNEGGIYLRNTIDSLMKMNNKYYIERVKEKIRHLSKNKDNLLIQSVDGLEQLDEALNLFSERLREWYGLYSPELSDGIKGNEEFATLVLECKRKKESMGADLEESDLAMIQQVADELLNMFRTRERLVEYIKETTEKIAPNLSNLITPLIAAKLIALAGSLKRLAQLPASTVQVLGAESALFRHLRKGAKPPKHGVIFQDPRIHTAPIWQRGKIARSLASKIAIAVKIDFYSGEFDETIAEDFESRLKRIRKKYSENPKKRRKKNG